VKLPPAKEHAGKKPLSVVVVGETCLSEQDMATIGERLKRYRVCGGIHRIPWHCTLPDTNSRPISTISRGYPMSWVTAVWSTNAAACLTLAGFYFVVWCKQRQNPVYLLFSCSAMAAAAISTFELWMLNSKTGRAIRTDWSAGYTCPRLCSRCHLWLSCDLLFTRRTSLVGVEYLRSQDARTDSKFHFCGEHQLHTHSPTSGSFHGVGSWSRCLSETPSPWGLLSSVSLLLLLVFSVDATITVWRRGDRRRALLIGGSMIFGAMLAWHVPLVIWGILDVPFFLGFTYTAIVAVMGYELSK